MHHRQIIRNAAANALVGLVTTGVRVFKSRTEPLDQTLLPCLLVNTDDEDIETITVHQAPILDRDLTLIVRCVAKASTNLDDVLDTMMAEVETAIGGQTLTGLVGALALKSIRINMESEAEKPVGIATMTFLTNYMTVSNNPSVNI